MNRPLLDEFLSEEDDAWIRQQLLDAIRAPAGAVSREFTFNRFIVRLDFGSRQVTLEDDLRVGPEGEERLDMDRFESALRRRQGN